MNQPSQPEPDVAPNTSSAASSVRADSFVIEDGKIVFQSSHYTMQETKLE